MRKPAAAGGEPATAGPERLRSVLAAASCVAVRVRTDALRLRGEGDIAVRTDPDGSVLTSESGTWRGADGGRTRFTNAYRWRFDGDRITVSHERRGRGAAVELVELVPAGAGRWAAARAHLCGEDVYSATVRLSAAGVVLRWRVRGPHKCQLIRSEYRDTKEVASPLADRPSMA